MKPIGLFKTTKRTNRFGHNQKVYILEDHASHYIIRYFYREQRGRMVEGLIDKDSSCIGKVVMFPNQALSLCNASAPYMR